MTRPAFYTVYALCTFVLGLAAIGMASYAIVFWAPDPLVHVGLVLIALAGLAGLLTGVGLWRVAPWTHKSLIPLCALLAAASWIAQATAGIELMYCALSSAAIALFGMLASWRVYLRTNVAA